MPEFAAKNCPAPAEADLELDIEDLVALLAEDLRDVLARTLAERTPLPAREFTDRVIATDTSVAETDADAAVLGQAAAFMVLSSWLNSLSYSDKAIRQALIWVSAEIGEECADAARRAVPVVEAGVEASEEVPDIPDPDLLPGLVWLIAALVAENDEHAATLTWL